MVSGQVRDPVVALPFTVGGTDQAKDLFGLFDDTVARLLAVLK
jgi:zinc/manganese transport system substrate-binding protein